jgi:TrmH family RNA methyltransferase
MNFSHIHTLSQSEHKHLRALHKRSVREATKQCILEGEHLCEEYLKYRTNSQHSTAAPLIKMHTVIIPMDELPPQIVLLVKELGRHGATVMSTSPQKFELLCDTTSPQRILAVIDLPEKPLHKGAPMLVLDGIADPGNVGTMIRTADWFGVRNILLGQGSADRFHPKTLRSTMGSIFRCAVQTTQNLAETLHTEYSDYAFWGASLQGAVALEEAATRLAEPRKAHQNYGVVMGNEARGISPEVAQILHGTFKIRGGEHGAESLNVGIATGIALHEMTRGVV